MNCWKCHKNLDLPSGPLAFRAICDFCHVYLHVCKNCRYYQEGLANHCQIPGTEAIYDREKSNFCEEFAWRTKNPDKKTHSIEDVSQKLFGETPREKKDKPKDPFSSLFKD